MVDKRVVGRPVKKEVDKDRNKVSVYLTDKMYKLVRSASEIKGETISNLFKISILEYIKRHPEVYEYMIDVALEENLLDE